MIEVPKDVAADAAELPLVWLEVTYHANSEGRAKKRHVGAQKSTFPTIRGRMEA